MIDERTKNLNLPLPNPRNKLSDDCPRIVAAITGLDAASGDFEAILAGYQTELIRLADRMTKLELNNQGAA